jgi:hypothetical protein
MLLLLNRSKGAGHHGVGNMAKIWVDLNDAAASLEGPGYERVYRNKIIPT